MKLKMLFSFTLFCLSIFIIQSCTSEFASGDDSDSASIEIENEEVEIVFAKDYCRYRVTTSSNPAKIAIGTRVCFSCSKRVGCGRDMDTTITMGDDEVKVTGVRSAGTCVTCKNKNDIILA